MATIKAKGIKYGEKLTVECTEEDNRLKLTYNGEYNAIYEVEFRRLIQEGNCSMGLYYPTDGSMLHAYIVLYDGFFDELKEITVDGDIGTIPSEDGMIY